MIGITVIHVGDFKEKYLDEAYKEYSKRIGGYAKFEDICIKEENLPESPSDTQIEKALSAEGKQILAKLDPRSKKIALCVEGKQLSSEELSALMEKSAAEYSKITFIIGSSHGLSEEVKNAADMKLSFSKMTFPHQLMRVILAEQIYRGETIIAGKKYHK
ncbi:MAG: 23S rRNA (pseudouridine(1915)-N(3))-methyltransferase RlmH [Ruminococcaceae bacterium]|nr:23S rRNA (pseudouridine(1915)-N(3))-methyltransferase RlmH [Oscillospiraceae bacterium]